MEGNEEEQIMEANTPGNRQRNSEGNHGSIFLGRDD